MIGQFSLAVMYLDKSVVGARGYPLKVSCAARARSRTPAEMIGMNMVMLGVEEGRVQLEL